MRDFQFLSAKTDKDIQNLSEIALGVAELRRRHDCHAHLRWCFVEWGMLRNVSSTFREPKPQIIIAKL